MQLTATLLGQYQSNRILNGIGRAHYPVPMSHAAQLRAFHCAANGPSPDRPTCPDPALLDLREQLIAEEAAEVAAEFAALRQRLSAGSPVAGTDLAGLAHELVDLLYVTYGALDAFGLPADAIFDAVHEANLAKTRNPVVDASGKLGKPAGWRPADVHAILQAME